MIYMTTGLPKNANVSVANQSYHMGLSKKQSEDSGLTPQRRTAQTSSALHSNTSPSSASRHLQKKLDATLYVMLLIGLQNAYYAVPM